VLRTGKKRKRGTVQGVEKCARLMATNIHPRSMNIDFTGRVYKAALATCRSGEILK